MKASSRKLLMLLPSGVGHHRASLHFTSAGVENFRQVLQQLGQDVKNEARPANSPTEKGTTPPTATGSNLTAHSDGSRATYSPANSLQKSAILIKELLRIFTRKVPGGLVPDGLVRGFMQAYRELHEPQERLGFFSLVSQEMGMSVAEVTSAVRLWDAVQARPSPPAESPAAPVAAAEGCAPTAPVAAAAASGAAVPPSDAAYRAADRIVSACRPLYTQLFLPISRAPQGMKFLVDMRADLLQLAAPTAPDSDEHSGAAAGAAAAALRAMADHLRQSLAEWFSVGLLQLQPISWQDSPAALLERVMRCEAVHPVGGWEELRRRLGPRRRVFAFTHPCMPGEPLVVVHTALLGRPAAALSDILRGKASEDEEEEEEEGEKKRAGGCGPRTPASGSGGPAAGGAAGSRPEDKASGDAGGGEFVRSTPSRTATSTAPSTAVFYSISASQPGLRGIDLGQFLIKRAAERLMSEHPSIRRLMTLSPLPNFRAWLVSRLRQEQRQQNQRQQQQQQQQQPSALPMVTGGDGGGTGGRAAAAPAAGGGGSTGDAGVRGGGSAGDGVAGASESGLLRPHEVEEVVRLAREMGWEAAVQAECSGGSGGATSSAAHPRPPQPPPATAASAQASAAAALCWLLEGDRWLSGRSAATRRGSGGGGGAAPGAAVDAVNAAAAAAAAEAVLRPLLMRLAARYLAVEKRRRFALCPVAHFHLRNGASLWRLNWGADLSPLGLNRSCGIMVNYEYELPYVYDNNWKYIMLHEVQAHPQVLALL